MGGDLKIKVCGMKDQENLDRLSELAIDYVGHIFYAPSPRNIEQKITLNNQNVKTVGVFVNASIEFIKEKTSQFSLEIIQLHGHESNELCKELKSMGLGVWKVLSVDEYFDFDLLTQFPDTDLFLLDTKSPKHGGTGVKFDWSILNKINENTPKPFILSGGIGVNDVEQIKALNLEKLVGLDLNSQFEIEPGLKNIELIEKFLTSLKK